MKRGIEVKKELGFVVIVICFVGSIAWMLACAMPKYFVAPTPAERYGFAYSVPQRKPPGSVKLTIAVVNPEYIEKLSPQYSTLARSFSNALGASLDEIIVAKGMTAKGPYENLEIISYPDKQATDLTLSPRVSINFMRAKEVSAQNVVYVKSKGQNILGDIVTYEMDVEGWISLEMREPLSGEKMWIKKLDLGMFKVNYEVAYRRGDGRRTNQDIFDTREDAVALSLGKMYPKILQTTWDYLNTDEMTVLNKKAEEIRKLKRY